MREEQLQNNTGDEKQSTSITVVETEWNTDKTVLSKLIEIYHWFKYRFPYAELVNASGIKEHHWAYNSVMIKGIVSTVTLHDKTYVGLVLSVKPEAGLDCTQFIPDFIKHMLSIYSDVMIDNTSGTPIFYWNC